MSRLGKRNGALYALPTDKGSVCFVFTDGPYGGCVPTFGGDMPVPNVIVDPDQYGSGDPTQTFGLAPNSVAEIDVVVNGKRYKAELANNAYFYELADPSASPSRLVVSYKDGASVVMDIAAPPASE
jgi:hypothetical protein